MAKIKWTFERCKEDALQYNTVKYLGMFDYTVLKFYIGNIGNKR
jgi:hypothetical protein